MVAFFVSFDFSLSDDCFSFVFLDASLAVLFVPVPPVIALINFALSSVKVLDKLDIALAILSISVSNFQSGIVAFSPLGKLIINCAIYSFPLYAVLTMINIS